MAMFCRVFYIPVHTSCCFQIITWIIITGVEYTSNHRIEGKASFF